MGRRLAMTRLALILLLAGCCTWTRPATLDDMRFLCEAHGRVYDGAQCAAIPEREARR